MAAESPYATSHKGLRHALARFELEAGRARYDEPGSLDALKARGRELALLLSHHLEAENRWYLAPLRARDEAAALHDLGDHERLEPLQQRMMETLEAMDTRTTREAAHAFYLLVTEFHAKYLEHILHEERVTEARIRARFSDAEIDAMSGDVVRHVELPVLLASLRYIVPAQPVAESRALLARLREAPFYADVIAALRADLSADELARLVD